MMEKFQRMNKGGTMGKYDVFDSKFAYDIFKQKYSMDGQESWADTCTRVVNSVCGQLITPEQKDTILFYMLDRKFIPAGRYLYSSGRPKHQVNNCFMFRCEDSKEGWGDLLNKSAVSLATGGGIGIDYSKVRGKNEPIKGSGGLASGVIPLIQMVNEVGRGIMQAGSRRSAIWAGLNWEHKDIDDFLVCKNWPDKLRKLKEEDLSFQLPMEGTNISIIYDTKFFLAIDDKKHPDHKKAKDIWNRNLLQSFKTAEPAMSFNFLKDSESLRNACNEVTSEDDSDKCNLGTIFISKIKDKIEFMDVIHHATLFLICGGIYSDTPTDKIREVGLKNNRIGLGLGGIHEWLMQRGMKYEVTPELHSWLSIFQQESDASAYIFSKQLGVAIPKGKRAIAPNGTLGIIAETTTGVEPLFCKAYKRRYLKGTEWHYQYVVDGSVKRMLESGIQIEHIQDAYDLDFKSRVKFQADVQNYIDMSISSTCNMPDWGSPKNNESTIAEYSKILLKYARRLRGFTVYSNGCRGGQPLTPVSLEEALAQEGVEFKEEIYECVNGICGL